jgi:hypothetical protein
VTVGRRILSIGLGPISVSVAAGSATQLVATIVTTCGTFTSP